MRGTTRQRQSGRHRRLAGVVATVMLGAALGVTWQVISPSPAGACDRPSHWSTDSSGNLQCHYHHETPGTSTPGSTGGPGGDGDGDGPTQPACPDWRLLGGYDSVASHIRPYSWDDAPPGALFYYDACTSPLGFGPGSTTTWFMPGEEPAPVLPTPGEVAAGLWLDLSATLLRPALVTSPEQGERALVEVPTFVAVSNWQGEVSQSGCDSTGIVCVSLTATPELRFDPGEPGSDVIVCDPPGTYFDPDGAEPDAQAAVDGACAHSYQRRTSVAGRPSAWPGEVSVVWSAVWQATAGSERGEYELTLSTDLPRSVREAPTVVVDDD